MNGSAVMPGHDNESHGPQSNSPARRSAIAMARGLGWLSIGLDLAEAFAPGVITGWLGM
jgi:hypothetical protein